MLLVLAYFCQLWGRHGTNGTLRFFLLAHKQKKKEKNELIT